jgi:hypothetical protein
MRRFLSASSVSGITGVCVLAALVSAPAGSEDSFCDDPEPWDVVGYLTLVRPLLRLPCVTTSRETLQALQLVTRAGENLRHDDEGKQWERVKSGGF